MSGEEKGEEKSVMGLYGLGVMGVNFALNVAEKGFRISVFNRTLSKVRARRAARRSLSCRSRAFAARAGGRLRRARARGGRGGEPGRTQGRACRARLPALRGRRARGPHAFAVARGGDARCASPQIESFVDSLESPRRIMFLVKAGEVVDKTIEMFSEYLEVRLALPPPQLQPPPLTPPPRRPATS